MMNHSERICHETTPQGIQTALDALAGQKPGLSSPCPGIWPGAGGQSRNSWHVCLKTRYTHPTCPIPSGTGFPKGCICLPSQVLWTFNRRSNKPPG